jgi:hypothetical protein
MSEILNKFFDKKLIRTKVISSIVRLCLWGSPPMLDRGIEIKPELLKFKD